MLETELYCGQMALFAKRINEGGRFFFLALKTLNSSPSECLVLNMLVPRRTMALGVKELLREDAKVSAVESLVFKVKK